MTPGEGAVSTRAARVRGGRGFSRIAAIIAVLLIAVAIIVLLLSSGGNSNSYKLVFETGGQLVKGNQVLIGGAPVGSVDDVKLIDNGQAEVDISVDRPLHEGTSAIIRATSLSGIANRYVSIQPGPDNAPELGKDATITQVDTTSPVDLDQLFNTLRGRERQALRNIIQGSSTVYAGKGPEANRTYKYLSPSLVATDRLLQELDRDEGNLTNFLVSGADVVSAVAERRADLSALTQNANEALGAIAAQNRSFDQALVALPPALRQANTTFHNLRPALDDLDVLVNASKPATKNLPRFLRDLKPVTARSVPVFRDLARAVNLKGKQNDLADATGFLPAAPEACGRGDPDHRAGDAGLPGQPAIPASLRARPDGRRRPPQPGRGLLRRRRPLPARGALRLRHLLRQLAGRLQGGVGEHLHPAAAGRRERLQRLSGRPHPRHLPPLPGRLLHADRGQQPVLRTRVPRSAGRRSHRHAARAALLV